MTPLNKSFNAAVGSAQSRLMSRGRRFAELAGQSGDIDVGDQIDELVGDQAGWLEPFVITLKAPEQTTLPQPSGGSAWPPDQRATVLERANRLQSCGAAPFR